MMVARERMGGRQWWWWDGSEEVVRLVGSAWGREGRGAVWWGIFGGKRGGVALVKEDGRRCREEGMELGVWRKMVTGGWGVGFRGWGGWIINWWKIGDEKLVMVAGGNSGGRWVVVVAGWRKGWA
ncbi:hypothetical protein HPP92_028849 [Vanilla planifolia]|uniref:Uncharacterized protein n=1 Tax=Vanilla planifolia TaxID=51239 RepID=A0A835P9E6_VANPL|nr:hypothetical protein HPP92_028849 [Vanilla planifolia]KAG0446421.1 hypothetical protein HPP92_028838 [Vanilla planifolia]